MRSVETSTSPSTRIRKSHYYGMKLTAVNHRQPRTKIFLVNIISKPHCTLQFLFMCIQYFISKSTNPFLNLAFEDWLFRHNPTRHILFFYRNTQSIVIGRNQNPWKEINFTALRAHNVPLVRRNSGGGTVYHVISNLP